MTEITIVEMLGVIGIMASIGIGMPLLSLWIIRSGSRK